MSVSDYLTGVLRKIRESPVVKRLSVRRMEASSERGFVRVVALLIDDSELHVFEYVDSGLNRIGYAYHLQDQAGNLVFRYDDEPHYPELPTFPHHKHVSSGVSEASEEVDIDEVLVEAATHVADARKKAG